MTGYPLYLLTRLGQFALVVFIGINIAFVVTHATPLDPVEQFGRHIQPLMKSRQDKLAAVA